MAAPLGSAGYAVDTAGTAREALGHARQHTYDGIALALVLPDQAGLALLADIRASGSASQGAPVVGLSVQAGSAAPQAAAFAVTDVLAKPLQPQQVLQAMAACGLRPESQARVMVVDDDPLALDMMHATLQTVGLQATGWQDARQALRDIDSFRPQAIVLDLMMPGLDGFQMLEALGQLPAWRAVPVFIWTSMELSEADQRRLAASASAVLDKGGASASRLVERLRSRP